MKTSTVIRKQLEAELKRVETRLAQLETELPRSPGSASEGSSLGDPHDFALTSENKEAAYENRSRLVSRLHALRDASAASARGPTAGAESAAIGSR